MCVGAIASSENSQNLTHENPVTWPERARQAADTYVKWFVPGGTLLYRPQEAKNALAMSSPIVIGVGGCVTSDPCPIENIRIDYAPDEVITNAAARGFTVTLLDDPGELDDESRVILLEELQTIQRTLDLDGQHFCGIERIYIVDEIVRNSDEQEAAGTYYNGTILLRSSVLNEVEIRTLTHEVGHSLCPSDLEDELYRIEACLDENGDVSENYFEIVSIYGSTNQHENCAEMFTFHVLDPLQLYYKSQISDCMAQRREIALREWPYFEEPNYQDLNIHFEAMSPVVIPQEKVFWNGDGTMLFYNDGLGGMTHSDLEGNKIGFYPTSGINSNIYKWFIKGAHVHDDTLYLIRDVTDEDFHNEARFEIIAYDQSGELFSETVVGPYESVGVRIREIDIEKGWIYASYIYEMPEGHNLHPEVLYKISFNPNLTEFSLSEVQDLSETSNRSNVNFGDYFYFHGLGVFLNKNTDESESIISYPEALNGLTHGCHINFNGQLMKAYQTPNHDRRISSHFLYDLETGEWQHMSTQDEAYHDFQCEYRVLQGDSFNQGYDSFIQNGFTHYDEESGIYYVLSNDLQAETSTLYRYRVFAK